MCRMGKNLRFLSSQLAESLRGRKTTWGNLEPPLQMLKSESRPEQKGFVSPRPIIGSLQRHLCTEQILNLGQYTLRLEGCLK